MTDPTRAPLADAPASAPPDALPDAPPPADGRGTGGAPPTSETLWITLVAALVVGAAMFVVLWVTS